MSYSTGVQAIPTQPTENDTRVKNRGRPERRSIGVPGAQAMECHNPTNWNMMLLRRTEAALDRRSQHLVNKAMECRQPSQLETDVAAKNRACSLVELLYQAHTLWGMTQLSQLETDVAKNRPFQRGGVNLSTCCGNEPAESTGDRCCCAKSRARPHH
jgi:hypothetical protein